MKLRDNTGNCGVPCQRVSYHPSLSYARLSKFNVDKIALKDKEQRESTRQTFLSAREVSQRVIQDIREADEKHIRTIMGHLSGLQIIVNEYDTILENSTDFAESLKMVDLIGQEGHDILEEENGIIWYKWHIRSYMISEFDYGDELEYVGYYIEQLKNILLIHEGKSYYLNVLNRCVNDSIEIDVSAYSVLRVFDVYGPEHDEDSGEDSGEKSEEDNYPTEENDIDYEAYCHDIVQTVMTKVNVFNVNQLISALTNVREEYEEVIEIVFANTSKDPFSLHEHGECLNTLNQFNATGYELFPAMINIELEISKSSDLEEFTSKLSELDVLFKKLTSMSVDHEACDWLEDNGDGSLIGRFAEAKFMASKALSAADNYYGDLAMYTNMLREQVDSLHPLVDSMFDDFLVGNLSKSNLTFAMDSRRYKRNLVDFVDTSVEFENVENALTDKLNEVRANWKLIYESIFDMEIPLIKQGNAYDFAIVQDVAMASNNTRLASLVENLDDDPLEALEDIVDISYGKYISRLKTMRQILLSTTENLLDHIMDFEDDLHTYMQGNRMDETFFM